MPCIMTTDIEAAVDKTYPFWHGHDGMLHMFTVTADNFKALQQGQSLLLYTTMVEDHRHPLQIAPGTPCASAACVKDSRGSSTWLAGAAARCKATRA